MGDEVKKVWLINNYAMPPEFESRLRTIKFADYLCDFGYDVTIFSSSFLHNMNKNLIEDNSSYVEKNYGKLRFIHINTISYRKNGLARFIGLFQFHLKLYFLCNKFEKPDVIVHTALPPFGNIIYLAASKLKSKYIAEILDLWPESFVDLGILKRRNLFIQISYSAEKWLYQKADKIVFSMEGGKDYIINQKWDIKSGGSIDLKKVYYINNGVDLDDFEYCRSNFRLEDADLNNDRIKKVIYIGSIRLANNLQELVNAAALLKSYSYIKFLLYGDGDDRIFLEQYCKKNKLDNVIFKQRWIEPKYVPYVLSMSSLNILNYKSGSFGKYGGSQSKLFQYLASGKPICANIDMMYCPIKKYDLGISKQFDSDKEYADAIFSLLNLSPDSYSEMRKRMQKIVAEYDYKELTRKLTLIL
jgi:glycosyltransferase involved in cell wall biosynthesis